jgi:MoaA/NifB/PqqE/SkfB family radical SAM enzyme
MNYMSTGPIRALKRWGRAIWGRVPLPRHLQIEPTTCCNLCCANCVNRDLPDSRRRRSMSVEFFQQIVEQIPTLREVKLQGLGEPLATSDLMCMLEWGKTRGLQFDIITNGMMPVEKTMAILPLLTRLGISLDTVSEHTSQTLRGGSQVSRILQTIRAVVKEKQRQNSSVEIRINCVVSHLNIEEIPELLRMASELGVDMVNLVLVENWKMLGDCEYEASANFVATAHDRVRLDMLRKHHKECGYAYRLGIQDGSLRKGCCYWTFSSVFVTCDGFVTPCCIRPDPRSINFGNLHEESFKNIWNGRKMRAFRRSHLLGTANIVCDRCPG